MVKIVNENSEILEISEFFENRMTVKSLAFILQKLGC